MAGRNLFSVYAGLGGLVSGVLAAAPASSAPPSTQSDRRPNVLLIMTDQQTYAALGCAGHPLIRTPNLDRLAREGTRFTQAVCATPFCSPTRASIRTGRWPHAHGITANVAPDERVARRTPRQQADRSGLTDEHVVLDNLLFDQGFAVEHLGKWHLGLLTNLRCYREKAEDPFRRDGYLAWLSEQGDAVRTREAHHGETFINEDGGVFITEAIAKARAAAAPNARGREKTLQTIGRSAMAPQAQFETWLADRAIEWLERHADHPFMLTYSPSPPHAPWIAPDPYYSQYDPARMVLPASWTERPDAYRGAQATRMGTLLGEAGLREQLRCYAAQVTMMDAQIGRILDTLRGLGLERNTLVIFTSDHGDMQGAHGMVGKSAFMLYEEVVRVPLIVRYPPSVRPGAVLTVCANSVDLMPTVLDYVGCPIPKTVQGHSLRPVLDGAAALGETTGYCERGRSGTRACRMIRTAEWKYNVFGDGRRELFHLSDDPGEVRNLAADPAYRADRERLEARLRAWMGETGDPAAEDLFASGG